MSETQASPEKMALAPSQEKILNFVRDFIASRGFPPTLREISLGLGYRSLQYPHEVLKILEQKGWVEISRITARGIRILP